ncbi:MAG: PAS domain S-box protein, partial [Bacteroidota bacterium]
PCYHEASYNPILNRQQEVTGVAVFVKDITEQKLAEINYSTIFNSVNDIILVIHPKSGRLLTVNARFHALFGYGPESLEELTLAGLSADNSLFDQKALMRLIKRAASGKEQLFEWKVTNRDGQAMWLEVELKNALLAGKKRVLGVARDVSKRKLAEEERIEAEIKYSELVESVSAVVWRADADSLTFSFVSHEAETLLGYKTDVWLNEPNFWLHRIHPEDRDRILKETKVAMAELRPHQLEYRMITDDGRIIWISDTVDMVIENNVPTELLGFMIDITEKKLAEEALRYSEEKYRSVVELSPIGIIIHQQGKVVFANNAAANIMRGESPEAFLGLPVLQFVHPDYADLVRERIGNIIRESKPAELTEEKFLTLDGQVI